MALSPRDRRLRSDHEAMLRLSQESSIISFSTQGTPPDRYLVTFRGTGIAREPGKQEIVLRDEHIVLIGLTAAYPRMIPELVWKTPIFHPNISAGGVVCLGGYQTNWVPSLRLDELCLMLWDMIRFANYDVESPYNRDAALWAKNYRNRFPVDPRPLRNLTVERGRIATESGAAQLIKETNQRGLDSPAATLEPANAVGALSQLSTQPSLQPATQSAELVAEIPLASLESVDSVVACESVDEVLFIDAEIIEPSEQRNDILFIE